MRDCSYNSLLNAYYDGELPIAERQRMEQHLASGCAACNSELQQVRRISAVLGGARDVRLSANRKEAIYALAPTIAERGYLRLTEWVTGLAAAIVLAGSIWLATSSRPAPVQPLADSGTGLTRQFVINPADAPVEAPADQSLADVVNDLAPGDQS